MNVGLCRVKLRLPENESLKGKRHVVKSIIERVKSRFNVAIAEVDDQEFWQLATLGIACVSDESAHCNEILSRVVSYIQANCGDAEFLDYEIEMLSAF